MSLLTRPYKKFFVYRPGSAGAVFLGNTVQYHRVTPWVTGYIYLPLYKFYIFSKNFHIFY